MTTATVTAPAAEYVAAYGMKRPSLGDARGAVERIFRTDAARMWDDLAARADAVGAHDEDAAAFDRVLAAMQRSTDDVVQLCARALTIRQSSYRHLAAANAVVCAH